VFTAYRYPVAPDLTGRTFDWKEGRPGGGTARYPAATMNKRRGDGGMEVERGLVKTSYGHVHYRAAGQGSPVILLHINQQSSALFLELMAVLADDFRVTAIDYPSCGMSDHFTSPPAVADYVRSVIEVMDGLDIAKTNILAEAGSTAIATEIANAAPDRVGRLVLVNSHYYTDRAAADSHHTELRGRLRPADSSGFPMTRTLDFVLESDAGHMPMNPTQSWMDRINVAQIEAGRDRWQFVEALAVHDYGAGLERLQQPTLLIWGENFHYSKFRDEFTRRIRNHQLMLIEDARFALTWERPEKIGRAAIDFFTSSN
jgi:pimeloyl-ACP methyl ester carboxylesterase